jgi:glucose/mannose-6-phosphate isomerase
MINPKYYQDIRAFPSQFREGFELAQHLNVSGKFNNVVVCGMGGSSLYVELVNDILSRQQDNLIIHANRAYTLPPSSTKNTLFVVASLSGNTEETISCFKEIQEKKFSCCVFCSGGRLLQEAKAANVPLYIIPRKTQPRLSTGYFIIGLLKLLEEIKLITPITQKVLQAAERINIGVNEENARLLAKKLKGNVPMIYGTTVNSSLARIIKIKFNENAKTQAFWNFFPELNHNEMVGFTKQVMNPYFLILVSQFCHQRNKKRIEIFTRLMSGRGLPVEIITSPGETLIEELLQMYSFFDYVTYYLAEEYGVDPEPVELVEEFKRML